MTDQMREHETNQARAEQAQGTASPEAAVADRGTDLPPIPDDAIIIVPVRNVVLFPGVVVPLSLGRVRIDRGRAGGGAQPAPARRRRCSAIRPTRTRHRTQLHDGRHGRRHHALRHRTGRRPSHRLPGPAALPHAASTCRAIRSWSRASSASRSRRRPAPRSRRACVHLKERALEALQYLPQAPRELANAIQAIPTPARRRRPGRELHGHQARGEAGDPRDHRRQGAARQGAADAEPRASRCCACPATSASRPRRASTAASASTSCASS